MAGLLSAASTRPGTAGRASAYSARQSCADRAGLSADTAACGRGTACTPAAAATSPRASASDRNRPAPGARATSPRTPIVAPKTNSGAYAQGYSAPKASAPQPISNSVAGVNHRMTPGAHRLPSPRAPARGPSSTEKAAAPAPSGRPSPSASRTVSRRMPLS